MKKLAVLIGFLFGLFFSPAAIAQEKTVVIDADQVIDGDYFAGGETVTIYGTINGDLYAAGGQVTVDGVINGDLLAAGGNLEISGKIGQDARIAGGQINFRGSIGRNLTVLGGNINLSEGATIGGSVTSAGGNLNIGSAVAGDITAAVGKISLTPKAKINGDLRYWSEEAVSIVQGAVVSGEVVKNNPPKIEDTDQVKNSWEKIRRQWRPVGVLAGLATNFLVGLLLIKLLPKYSQVAVQTISQRPWASLGLGLIALLLGPIIIAIVLLTIIGIPIAFLFLAVWLIFVYLAKIFAILWAGGQLNRGGQIKPGWQYFWGLIAYTIASLIPIVGSMTKFFALIIGLGAMLLTCRATFTTAHEKK